MSPPRRPEATTACLVTALLALAGCGGGEPPLNVLVLTLDTTRADRFGFAGHQRAHTPRFDAFARERAVRFENAITAVPVTLPSHATIFTGTYPVFHGVRDNDGYILDDDVTTLAEILAGEGFATAAHVAAFPLDSTVNLKQGFQVYDDDFQADWTDAEKAGRTPLAFGFLERKADKVNRAVARWLADHREQRFFLWVHYFDPHQPWDPPPPYDSQFSDDLYDGEMAFMDEQFGVLLDLLEEHGLTGSTLIVVVGDHGEALGQHGEPTHATYLYDATMRVPFLVADPRGRFEPGSVVATQVRTVDVAPTVLDLLALPPEEEMQGRSLVPLLADPEREAAGEAYLESFYAQFNFGWAPLRAIRTPEWKYIEAPVPELYDVREDPEEVYDLVAARPRVAADLAGRLRDLANRHASADPGRSASLQIDQETRDKLEALGYLGGVSTEALRSAAFPPPEELAGLPNPADRALALAYINTSHELMRVGQYEEAVPVLENGLHIDPGNYRMRVNLARALAGTGAWESALGAVEEARRLRPELADSYDLEGRIHLVRRDWDRAAAAFEEAVRRAPQLIDPLRMLAEVYNRLGRHQDALAHWEALRELDAGDWETQLGLGEAYATLSRWDEARTAFQRALDLNPYSPQVRYNIAVFYRHLGELEFSLRMFQAVLQVAPDHVAASLHLAELLRQEGAPVEEVRPLAEKVLDLAPGSPWAERAERLLRDAGGAETGAGG